MYTRTTLPIDLWLGRGMPPICEGNGVEPSPTQDETEGIENGSRGTSFV